MSPFTIAVILLLTVLFALLEPHAVYYRLEGWRFFR